MIFYGVDLWFSCHKRGGAEIFEVRMGSGPPNFCNEIILHQPAQSGAAPGEIVREGEGTSGVQGAEPLGGGQGTKPPEAEAFLVLKL